MGGTLSWGSLRSFIKNLGTDSALARDLGKNTGWEDPFRTNAILADIYDLLQVIHRDLRALGGDKQHRKIKPYPRPGADKDKRKIGKGAMPFNDLREWFRRKRENYIKR